MAIRDASSIRKHKRLTFPMLPVLLLLALCRPVCGEICDRYIKAPDPVAEDIKVNGATTTECLCLDATAEFQILAYDLDTCNDPEMATDEIKVNWAFGDGSSYEPDEYTTEIIHDASHMYEETGPKQVYVNVEDKPEYADDRDMQQIKWVKVWELEDVKIDGKESPAEVAEGEEVHITLHFLNSYAPECATVEYTVSIKNATDEWEEIESGTAGPEGIYYTPEEIAEYKVEVSPECGDPKEVKFSTLCSSCSGGELGGTTPEGASCGAYTGSPGVRYNSGNLFETTYSVKPFPGTGSNAKWRLVYDRKAVIDFDENRITFIHDGQRGGLYKAYGGAEFDPETVNVYYNPVSEATAEYYPEDMYGEYDEAVIVAYYGHGSHSIYRALISASTEVHLLSKDEWSDGGSLEYTYNGSNQLTSVEESPADLTWTVSWSGDRLSYVESPAGVRTSYSPSSGTISQVTRSVEGVTFQRFNLTYTGDKLTKTERVNPDSPSEVYERRDFSFSGDEVTRIDDYYAGNLLRSATPAYEIADANVGSSSQQNPNGTYNVHLVTTIQNGAYKQVVDEFRDSSYDLIRSSTAVYDVARMLLQEATSVIGATSEYVYDYEIGGASQNLRRIVDVAGNYSGYDYDSKDRQIKQYVYGGEEAAVLSQREMEYDGDDRLILSYVYDSAESATLEQSEREYDSQGRLSASIDGEGRRTSMTYNDQGRLYQSGMTGALTTFYYDSLGRRSKVVAPSGATTEYAYTATGQVSSVTQYLEPSGTPTPVVTLYTCDQKGYGPNLLSVTDAEGYMVAYAYGAFDRLESETIYEGTGSSAAAYATRYIYYDDTIGGVTQEVDFRGWKTNYDYGSLSRLWRKEYYSTGDVFEASLEYEYDGTFLDSITFYGCDCGTPGEKIEYEYDETTGRLISRTDVLGATVGYSYDGAGRLEVLSYAESWDISQATPTPTPFHRQWIYDLADRVEAVKEKDAGTNIAEYDYNKASQRTQVDYVTGHSITYEYDSYGRLSLLANLTPSDATMSSFEYEYDVDGLRRKVTRENGDYIEYDYDGLNRLTAEVKKDSGGTPIWARSYQYDKVGNRTSRTRYEGGNNIVEDLSYNGLGQLATMEWTENSIDYRNLYSYDKNGNLTEKKREELLNDEVIDATRWVYAWDYADRLVSVVRYVGVGESEVVDGTVEYAYCAACDGALRGRIERDQSDVVVSWLRYEYEGLDLLRIDEVYDYDEDTVLEDPAEGDDRWRPLNVYTHGPGSIGQIIRNQTYWNGSPSTLIYYYYDALGNMVTYSYSSSGYGNYEMDAFGNRIPGSPTWPAIDSSGPKAKLTGKMYDEDTGLYYFHARWYDPETGRFASRDPLKTPPSGGIGCPGGTAFALQLSFLRAYTFALEDPANHVDPSGLLAVIDGSAKHKAVVRAAFDRMCSKRKAKRIGGKIDYEKCDPVWGVCFEGCINGKCENEDTRVYIGGPLCSNPKVKGYHRFGQVHICERSIKGYFDIKAGKWIPDTDVDRILAHEFIHSCGWPQEEYADCVGNQFL